MYKRNIYKIAILIAVALLIAYPLSVFARSEESENKFFLGSVINTGKDNGYSGYEAISKKDPHFGWDLGSFYVTGYTRYMSDQEGDPIFLKTVGDKVTLYFSLEQDIMKLNGNDMLTVCSDTNGFDQYFGIPQTDMGRGTLIVKYTDYQNHSAGPVIYTDYLAGVAQGAATQVELCEEGDYEIALNYEIRKDNVDLFGWNPFPSYYNYRIFFKFSVRNGNCMVFPFDILTGEELTNSAITENGFSLDLARSRYLNIDIKKSVRIDGAEGLTEDVRFNKPAKDGEQYTEEGIYTITVSNQYTNQTTTKVIYVGTDDVLKAHVTTGIPIADIEYYMTLGATVSEDGTLIFPPEETTVPTEETEPATSYDTIPAPTDTSPSVNPTMPGAEVEENLTETWLYIVAVLCFVAVGLTAIFITKKKRGITPTEDNSEPVDKEYSLSTARDICLDTEESGDNGGNKE